LINLFNEIKVNSHGVSVGHERVHRITAEKEKVEELAHGENNSTTAKDVTQFTADHVEGLEVDVGQPVEDFRDGLMEKKLKMKMKKIQKKDEINNFNG
jgi:hypothetical protein